MTERPAQSALRRKLVARRPGADIGRMTPLKGFRLAFARAAPDMVDMDVAVRHVSETRLGRDLLRDRLPDDALISLIEGQDRRFGLVVFDADTVAAAVEAQTTGRVLPTAPPPRAPTRTDAVLLADLVDRIHEILEDEAAEVELGRTARGFRYATVLEGPKAVGLTLEDVTYRLFDLRVELGGNVARPGRVLFAYPALDPVATIHTPDAWALALERAVEPAEAQIDAQLAKVSLPFERLAGLQPGDLIPLPREALVRIALTTRDGRILGRGRLGQAHGHKAVRITGPAEDAFHSNLPGPDATGAELLFGADGHTAWEDPINTDTQIEGAVPMEFAGEFHEPAPGGDEAHAPVAMAMAMPLGLDMD
jgi:flagellar motor switch protein FliM